MSQENERRPGMGGVTETDLPPADDKLVLFVARPRPSARQPPPG